MTDDQPKPRRTRADRLRNVHDRAMRQFDAIWSVVADDRARALSDRRFANVRGAQWEGKYAYGSDETADEETGVPRMEVNKIGRSKRRILSNYRQNRVTVDFRPKGQTDDEAADNLDGLYRADENDSRGGGQAAYDNAFDEALGGGFGAWRLRTRYEDESDEENEKQRVGIEPIYDADQSVFFDLDAKHQDKSDARFAYLIFSMTRDAFEEKYPDASTTTFANTGAYWADRYEWTQPDAIKLAEYFEASDHGVTRRTFRHIATGEERTEDDETLKADDGALEEELAVTGWEEVRRRRIKRQRVRKYILSGEEVLSDEGYIAGPNIPIVPLYKERFFIDGVEKWESHTGPLIDPSRIYNMLVSNLTEGAAASPISTPVVLTEQIQGHEQTWARRNVDRLAYLPINGVYDENGGLVLSQIAGTLTPPELSPHVAALLQVASTDLAELSGDSSQVEDVPANTSAQAIELVNDRVDDANFLEFDNIRKAMRRSGEIWMGMAREIYVEPGREMVAIDQDGGQSRITLSDPDLDTQGAQVQRNDLTRGDWNVIVDVGPASKTRRDATVRSLLGIAQVAATAQDLPTANAMLGVAFINMDGEGLDDVKAWKRAQLVRQGIIKPNEQEQAELEQEAQNQQPDPQAQLVQAATTQAMAEAKKAEAGTVKTLADVELTKAKTAQIGAEIGEDATDRAFDRAARLTDQVHDQQRHGDEMRMRRDEMNQRETPDA